MGLRRMWLAGAVLLVSLLPFVVGPPPVAYACELTGGFLSLHDLIPEIVGACTADAEPAQGGAAQRTDRGILMWREADNWTAFTDGATTWVIGPCGLQSRPNNDSLPFERGEPCEPPTAIPPPPSPPEPTATPEPTAAPEQAPPAAVPTELSPEPPDVPGAAGIACNDGWISHAAHRQGACSHHGGIAALDRPCTTFPLNHLQGHGSFDTRGFCVSNGRVSFSIWTWADTYGGNCMVDMVPTTDAGTVPSVGIENVILRGGFNWTDQKTLDGVPNGDYSLRIIGCGSWDIQIA